MTIQNDDIDREGIPVQELTPKTLTDENRVDVSQIDKSKFPRNVTRAMMTDHIRNRMDERNITLFQVEGAVEDGEIVIEEGYEMDEVVYRDSYPGQDVLVVYAATLNNLKTVTRDDSQEGGIKFTGILDRDVGILDRNIDIL